MNTSLQTGLEPSAWLAAIVEGSQDAIVSKTLEGTILSWNAAAQKLFGYTAEEAIGRPITLIIPDDRLHEEETIIANIRAGIRTEHFETVRRRKDGSFIEVSLTISPVRDGQGRLLGASKVARDITQARQVAEQQTLLLHEMDHRIKNLFMLANALVAQSRREADTVDALAQDLQARFTALARAHETTVRTAHRASRPAASSLLDLLDTILKPYQRATGPHIAITGCSVAVGASQLASLALLLHELATNSAKHGALRSVTGRLAVAVTVNDADVRLTWCETGQAAALTRPTTTGFGSRLEAAAARALGATVTRDWQPDRLTIVLAMKKDALGT